MKEEKRTAKDSVGKREKHLSGKRKKGEQGA